MSFPKRLWQASALTYAALFVLWRLLVASPLYDRWWLLQVSDIFALLALAPLPIFIFVGLIWRSRLLWLALLVPSLWFVFHYGGLFAPSIFSVAKAKSGEDTLRL